ncbi:MAG: YgjV family protein [Clostridiales bacterium]|jgi:hypothetical protein|nr:YgjV family protein [Clostridiales bacterium]
MTFWIVQSLGVITLIFYVVSLQMKKKENLLMMQIFSNIFFTAQYLLTNALTGAVQAILSILRGVVFYIFKKKDLPPSKTILGIFEVLVVATTVLTWKNIISVLPLIGMTTNLYGQWQDKMNMLRRMTIITSICWLVYELTCGMYTAMITEICIIVSGVIGLYRFRKHA